RVRFDATEAGTAAEAAADAADSSGSRLADPAAIAAPAGAAAAAAAAAASAPATDRERGLGCGGCANNSAGATTTPTAGDTRAPPRMQWRELIKVSENARSVTCRAVSSGVYLLTQRPQTESFLVSSRGGLHRVRMCPRVSVRVPRGSCTGAADCCLTILPFPTSLPASATAELLALSPIYDFRLSAPLEFRPRRPATLRLPLPQPLPPRDAADSVVVAVLRQSDDSAWRVLLELPLSHAETVGAGVVSVDTRRLSAAFCLAVLRPGLPAGGPQRVAASVLPLIRGLAEAPPGRLLAFVDLRSAVGWRLCFRWQMTGAAANSDGDGGGGGNWQAVGGSSPMRLREGATFAVRLTGQLQLKLATSAAVQFRQACPNLPVVMAVKPSEAAAAEAAAAAAAEPGNEEPRPQPQLFRAQLTVADEYNSVVLSAELSYNLESLSQLQQALTVPAEAALEKQQPAAAPPPSSPAIKKAAASQSPKSAGLGSRPGRLLPRQQPATEAAAVNRDREPRVLSGRSLQALAEHLQQRQLGQHLARLLHLPDATVAGLGFDTAAAATSPATASLAYKVLLQWKRSVGRTATGA
uniref:Death domain-containing protein n=1 Tax=Macrostomum lignano TaxID=282301 RepID=A0A1I8GIJ4_9PLAT